MPAYGIWNKFIGAFRAVTGAKNFNSKMKKKKNFSRNERQ